MNAHAEDTANLTDSGLILRYLAGALSDDGGAEFSRRLSARPELRKGFAERLVDSALLAKIIQGEFQK